MKHITLDYILLCETSFRSAGRNGNILRETTPPPSIANRRDLTDDVSDIDGGTSHPACNGGANSIMGVAKMINQPKSPA